MILAVTLACTMTVTPVLADEVSDLKQKKQERTAGLYAADRSAPFKRAEYNPVGTSMMDAYTPDQRHDLLHVDYTK